LRTAVAASLFLVLAPISGPTSAQTSISQVNQANVVELQWREYREFSRSQRERGAVIDEATRALEVDRVFLRLLPVAWRLFPESRALRWEVLLTEDDSLEARAYPSGQIVVSAPFLSRFVRSDDELAFLLGHEMAHVLLEHGRRGYEAAVPLTHLAGTVDATLIHENLQSSMSLHLRLLPLLRAQEGEADRLGVQLAVDAGFDASAGSGLLERMDAAGEDPSPAHDSLQSRSAALRPIFGSH
jgi:predicted Zn-dependent protease